MKGKGNEWRQKETTNNTVLTITLIFGFGFRLWWKYKRRETQG